MIRLDYLGLIETDELERLPGGAYAKGFIRQYSNYLGLDPAPFIAEYERRCEQPDPTMMVRRPVRVPHAVQPRTWRMAALAGLTVLLILGLLGVLRSGDETAKPPVRSGAEVAALATGEGESIPNPAGAVVRVEVVGERAWIQAEQDGTVAFAGTLRKGERKVFRAPGQVYLVLGNARAVRLTANGHELPALTSSTYRGTFTPTTNELPPSQPR